MRWHIPFFIHCQLAVGQYGLRVALPELFYLHIAPYPFRQNDFTGTDLQCLPVPPRREPHRAQSALTSSCQLRYSRTLIFFLQGVACSIPIGSIAVMSRSVSRFLPKNNRT
jgi:hypothetical protein